MKQSSSRKELAGKSAQPKLPKNVLGAVMHGRATKVVNGQIVDVKPMRFDPKEYLVVPAKKAGGSKITGSQLERVSVVSPRGLGIAETNEKKEK